MNRRNEIGKKYYTAYNVYIISFKIQKFKEKQPARTSCLIFFTCFHGITHVEVSIRIHTTYREDFDCRAVQIVPLDGWISGERFPSIGRHWFDEIRAELSMHRLSLVTLPLRRFVSKTTKLFIRKDFSRTNLDLRLPWLRIPPPPYHDLALCTNASRHPVQENWEASCDSLSARTLSWETSSHQPRRCLREACYSSLKRSFFF